jgi:upstream activation factor subunit UAF30
MPKQTKTKIVEVPETTTAPVETPVEKTPKQSKPRQPKQKVKDEPVVVATEHAVDTPAPAPTATESEPSDELSAKTDAFLAKLNELSSAMNALKAEFRTIEKSFSRQLKTAQKAKPKGKRQPQSGNRQPSGFMKLTKISDELAKFLGKDKGSEMCRTEVTQAMDRYIKQHKLQDPENGRKIIPDEKMQKLLKLAKGQELTYFNLQKFMAVHFIKEKKPVAAATA